MLGSGHEVRDLGSTNGTFVNGQRIQAHQLQRGDVIQIGPFKLVYDGRSLDQFDQRGAMRIDARTLVRAVGGGRIILNNVSLVIHPREFVALVGGSGAGKSTLMGALSGYNRANKGLVLVNGDDYYANFDAYRAVLGYVPQDVFLFSDSIRNNIAFGNPQLSEAKMLQAARDADLYENIERFPEGFDTKLGERGITLSGGQKQRLSIARAIAREPKILILDDCLSAVDTKTENSILNSLKSIMADRTSIIISHRVSSAKLADRIIVLDDGRMMEEGTHESLMALNGVYKELYDKQLQTEEV